ncbi:MAG: three-Cys-motif partner protein TcmP, partial [Hymenobacter sp.]
MSKKNSSTRQMLASHSAAKVEVFSYYLSTYLNILGMAGMRRVHIYDLMCGEGQYADGRYGSALVGLRRVLAYFSTYPSHSLRVAYTLNDAGMSDVEPGRRKIDRVQERAERLPFDAVRANGRFAITYGAEAYEQATANAIARTRSLPAQEKTLLFIDPWGYKDIRIADLRAALASGQSEVLLFLPAEMMYRFARKAYHEPFSGGEALHGWLTELFPEQLPTFGNVHNFINQFRLALQVQVQVPYSSRFTLETEDHNTYSLFYFTSSRKGLKSMLEAQWKHDQRTSKAHV